MSGSPNLLDQSTAHDSFCVAGVRSKLLPTLPEPSTSNQILRAFFASLLFLVILGALAAYTGGAVIVKGVLRIALWGGLAMAITAGLGMLFGVSV